MSLFASLYYLINSSIPVTCHIYPESYKNNNMEASAIEMIIGSITKIICFLLPIIIPLKAFWLAKATIKPLKSLNISQQESLRINDSFAGDEEKKFWKSLKFNSKNTESSTDKMTKNTLQNHGKNSEIEEEKSPIDRISILSQTLQNITNEQKIKIYKKL